MSEWEVEVFTDRGDTFTVCPGDIKNAKERMLCAAIDDRIIDRTNKNEIRRAQDIYKAWKTIPYNHGLNIEMYVNAAYKTPEEYDVFELADYIRYRSIYKKYK